MRCHGGFDDDGAYVSPRTANRVPAIAAWQAKHRRDFGTELLDLPLDTWPEHYPNVAQARYLIEGRPEPIISTLTRIGTVEGFGAMIRHSPLPDLQRMVVEDTGHRPGPPRGGLFEAHARDEAGFEDEGGHEQMWFAARDVAFENPVTEDQRALMLERMGIAPPGSGGQVDLAALRAAGARQPLLARRHRLRPRALITRMIRLLLIEISAFHTFAWAEELLADPDLVAGDGEGARLVSYIRADETPHVDYLRTALSEMRDRTIVGEGGRRHAGGDLVGRIWDRALAQSLGPNRRRCSRRPGARCATPSGPPGCRRPAGPVRRAGLGAPPRRRHLGRGPRRRLISPRPGRRRPPPGRADPCRGHSDVRAA